jgi:hypothetical protein
MHLFYLLLCVWFGEFYEFCKSVFSVLGCLIVFKQFGGLGGFFVLGAAWELWFWTLCGFIGGVVVCFDYAVGACLKTMAFVFWRKLTKNF